MDKKWPKRKYKKEIMLELKFGIVLKDMELPKIFEGITWKTTKKGLMQEALCLDEDYRFNS